MNQQVFESKLNEILIFFNFDKVECAMTALGWKWGGDESSPTKYDMVKLVRGLGKHIMSTQQSDGTTVASGGFELTIKDNDVFLKFVVESSDSNEFLEDALP